MEAIYQKKSIIIVLLSSFMTVMLTACATPVALIEMVAEDRTAANIETDTKIIAGITTNINNQIGTKQAVLITKDVYEQVVLITGTVPTGKMKTQAGDIAREYPGVKRVINELQVIAEDEVAKEGDNDFVDDFVVKQKFYGKLISTTGVNHTNWRHNSVNGVLYLFGRALSQSELNLVVKLAKSTDNVREVVNYAFVRAK